MGTLEDELRSIVDRFEIATTHSDDALGEAEAWLQTPGFDDDTVDQTAFAYVTIDNEDSRDLDQALFVRATDDGWRVYYALADAAYYVQAGSALFRDALERGSSFYFPTFAVPMLPPSLSEGLVSLNPDIDRRALVFEVDVDHDGATADVSVRRAKIRSRAKLSYPGVQTWFDRGEGVPQTEYEPPAEAHRSMVAFRDVGNALRRRSEARGVIEYDRTEANISVEGDRFLLVPRRRLEIEKWNEQISLLINTEGARLLTEYGKTVDDLQSVYRVHLPPLEYRLDELKQTLDRLCERHDLPDAFRWQRRQPLSDYLRELPDEPVRVAKAIQLQVRYTNRASEFSDRLGPHFALAVPQYARFSSPMREVVGIFTHKEALEAFGLVAPDASDIDRDVREQVIRAANDAKQRQKKIDKAVMWLAIRDHLLQDLDLAESQRPTHVGTVIAVKPTRVYVQLDDLPIELKVYVDDLARRYETTFEVDHAILVSGDGDAPTIGLGDRIALKTEHYTEKNRRFSFSIE